MGKGGVRGCERVGEYSSVRVDLSSMDDFEGRWPVTESRRAGLVGISTLGESRNGFQ